MECVTIGPIATNCYTVINEDTNVFYLYDETITLTSLCKFDLFISYYKEFEQQRREWMKDLEDWRKNCIFEPKIF